MNKLIYIYCFIYCFTMGSCDWYSDPLELVYPGTDLSGGGGNNNGGAGESTEDELINNFESILNTTWYGWKMSGFTTDRQDCTVFFIFSTGEKKVTTISTVRGRKSTTEYAIAVNAEKQVVINFAGTDAELFGDESFVILEAKEGTISCKGATTAATYTMTNADEDEVNDIDPSDIIAKMQKVGILSGVIRDEEGTFFAHYYVNEAANKLQITYLEDGLCKQEESGFKSSASAITLNNSIALKSVEILSIAYSSSTFSLTGKGVSSYQLESNANAGTYVKDGRHQFKLYKNGGDGVTAENTLMAEMKAWSVFTQLECNCSDFAAQYGAEGSLVVCGDFNALGWTYGYEFLVPKSGYLRAEEPDRVYFVYDKTLYGATAVYDAAKANIPSVLGTWFHADGLYLIINKEGDKTYLYLLSPTTNKWFKFIQTA